MDLTPSAKVVLEKRYLRDGETPEQMLKRVAINIAEVEKIYGGDNASIGEWTLKFFKIMDDLLFLPNSPTLMNAGRPLQQLSACFVVPIEDSIAQIFDAVKVTALIHQSGGGTGFSFSHLRPEGDLVSTTGGRASGPVTFMQVFNTGTEVVKQGGTRRGANMGILSVHHPDIVKFITSKSEGGLENFNLSVAVTDEFMKAVKKNSDYNLINPRNGEVVGTLPAGFVFQLIVQGAWETGDPGIIFIDEINRHNPLPNFVIESTNPCGEQPLLPYESCNLGSLNLGKFITPNKHIDYTKLRETIHTAVRFLDNVIDANRYPIPEIEEMTKKTRKIGLGVMGWADLLISMGIKYGSSESLFLARSIMGFINREATLASTQLARERGSFPLWDESTYGSSYANIPMRNACRTTIAPTGTISIIAGASSGIEPLFALAYTRENILDQGDVLEEVYPPLDELLQLHPDAQIRAAIDYSRKTGSFQGFSIPKALEPFITALEISYESHIAMQAAFQEYTDNAISKTINLPNSATQEDIKDAYLMAWENHCKGITLYRDGSRDFQVLNSGTEVAQEGPAYTIAEPIPTQVSVVGPRKRPTETKGTTTKVPTGCGYLYVTVNQDGTGICEVFSTLGKAGGCAAAQSEAISRLISLGLRSGIDPQEIVGQLQGIRCPSVAWNDGRAILSCPDALGQVLGNKALANLGEEIQMNVASFSESNLEKKNLSFTKIINSGGQCPECSHILVYQEGCFICPGCGYTKCG